MASTTIGDALRQLFSEQRWTMRIYNKRLQTEWETIVGKTIAKYTNKVWLSDKTLHIQTDEAILKHELQMMKTQLIAILNEYFETDVVQNIVIK